MITYDQIKESFEDVQDNSFGGKENVFIHIKSGVTIHANVTDQDFDLFVETKYTSIPGVKTIDDLKTLRDLLIKLH